MPWAWITCQHCGCQFAIPTALMSRLVENGVGFYCPNGHYLNRAHGGDKKLQNKLVGIQAKLDQAEAALRDLKKAGGES